MNESQNWGEGFSFTRPDPQAAYENYKIKLAIDEARERMYAEVLNPAPRVKPKWTIRDRLELAWKVLRGQITWDDIS